MSRPSPLASALLGVDADTRARFLADLHAARGRSVAVEASPAGPVVTADGRRLLVWDDGGLGRRLTRVAARVDDRSSRLGGLAFGLADLAPLDTDRGGSVGVDRGGSVVDVDAVFHPLASDAASLASGWDLRAVTAADVASLTRYGTPRAASDRACRDCLGQSLDALVSPESPLRSRATEPNHEDGARLDESVTGAPSAGTALTLVVVASLVVAAALVGGVAPALDDGSHTAATVGGASESTPTSADASSDVDDVTAEAMVAARAGGDFGALGATDDPGDARRLAPGLTRQGVVDLDALAAGHAAAVDDRSYTYEIVYTESRNGTVLGRSTERIRVESDRRYVSNVSRAGDLGSRTLAVVTRPAYADGERRHVLTRSGVVSRNESSFGKGGRIGQRAAGYVRETLDTEEFRVVRTLRSGYDSLYVLSLRNTTAPMVEDYRVTAHVASDGLVHYVNATYYLPEADSRVELTLWYREFGTTTVDPPEWYRRATANESTTARSTPTDSTDAALGPVARRSSDQ